MFLNKRDNSTEVLFKIK